MIFTTNNGTFINADFIEAMDTQLNIIHMASGNSHIMSASTMSDIANYMRNKVGTYQSY